MLRIFLTLLISFLLLSQNFLFGQAQKLPVYEDADAYKIYSLILSPLRPTPEKNLVILLETRKFPGHSEKDFSICVRPREELDQIVVPAIADYVKANKTTWQFRESFKLGVPYKLISQEAIDSIFRKGGWDNFYKQFPNSDGAIELSAVGFNAEKTIAVVYKGISCGPLCGHGSYYIFQKKKGVWLTFQSGGTSCQWVS